MKDSSRTTIVLMSQFGRMLRSRMRDTAAKEGCASLPQLDALQFVSEHEAPSMRDISQFLKVKGPSATSLVDELVRARLLIRHSDAADRRQVRLAITPTGRSTLVRTLARKEKIISSVLSKLSPKDQATLNGLLQKILITNA